MEAVIPVKVSDDHHRIYEEWGKICEDSFHSSFAVPVW